MIAAAERKEPGTTPAEGADIVESRCLAIAMSAFPSSKEVPNIKFPAFVYQPNVSIKFKELPISVYWIITLIGMYNAARLLSSWELYEIFVRQVFSLAMQLLFFSNDDGSLIFATYLERMPEHYMRDVWVGLLIIGNMTKNRRFLKSANALRPHIPAKWCESDGC